MNHQSDIIIIHIFTKQESSQIYAALSDTILESDLESRMMDGTCTHVCTLTHTSSNTLQWKYLGKFREYLLEDMVFNHKLVLKSQRKW